MMKKMLLVSLVFVTMLALAACGGGADAPADGDGLRIAIVTSPSGVDDGNFNQNNYEGILAFIEDNPGATVNAIQEPTGDVTASVQAVADIVADYDVIVTPGFQFAGISAIALENPDTYFILVDSDPEPQGDITEFDNIYAMTFAEEESGFFAGVAAALETNSGKVASLTGIAFPPVVNYQFGFESGVNYANQNLGTNVEIVSLPSYAGTDVTGANVGGNYVGDFNDPATGKVISDALIAQGVDIIFMVAGGSGQGAITAALEAGGVMVIGGDVDQYDDGSYSGGNIVLTSALKNMAINVERQLNAIADGTFQGSNNIMQMDTQSTGLVTEEGRHQMSDETLEIVLGLYDQVADGSIVPASNFNGHAPDNFPGL